MYSNFPQHKSGAHSVICCYSGELAPPRHGRPRMEVADRVAILNGGRIEQIGAPRDIRERPATPFVQAFLD